MFCFLKVCKYVINSKMRRIISVSSIAFLLVILTYSVISKLIFDRIYITSKQVIDEEFHIPQGLAYCNFHFDTVSFTKSFILYVLKYNKVAF